MHVEKNVYDSMLGTIMGIKGKSKDTTNARQDLRNLGIRCELWLKQVGNKTLKPQAEYTLSLIN